MNVMSHGSTFITAAVAVAGISFAGSTANAQLLAFEGFEGYTNGSTVGGQAGGTGWGGAWNNVQGGDQARMLTVGQSGGWTDGHQYVGPDMGPETGTGHMALRGGPNSFVSRQLAAPITGQDVYLGYIANSAFIDQGFVGLTNNPMTKVTEPATVNTNPNTLTGADWNGHMGAAIRMTGFDPDAFGTGKGGAQNRHIYAHNFYSFSRNGDGPNAAFPGSRESFGVLDDPNNPSQVIVRIRWDSNIQGYRWVDVWLDPIDLDNLGTPDSTRDAGIQGAFNDPGDEQQPFLINPTSFSHVVAWGENNNSLSGLFVDNVMVGLSASSVVIPEPGTVLLLGAGAMMLGLRRRSARA
jgi:hypothetical protein